MLKSGLMRRSFPFFSVVEPLPTLAPLIKVARKNRGKIARNK
jgi:hypothetical protein